MRKFALVLATFAIMVIVRVAQAAGLPCEWEINKTASTAVTLIEGDTVVVAVTAPARGVMRAPAGWVSRFQAQDACPGFPSGCGTWVATKTVSTGSQPGDRNDNGPQTFTVEGGQCANNARTYQLTVNAKPVVAPPAPPPDPNAATWTKDEKSEVQEHVRNAPEGGRYHMSAALLLMPNLPTTTSVGTGGELAFGAIVANGFMMGLALDYMRNNIPIEPALHPAVMAGSEDSWSTKIRLAWAPDISKYFHLNLGGEFGYNGSRYSTTFVVQTPGGQVESVMQRTQHSPVIGPYLRIAACPTEAFCFTGQFTNEIVFNRSRTIGEGATATNATLTTPESGHVQLNPMFGLGAGIFF